MIHKLHKWLFPGQLVFGADPTRWLLAVRKRLGCWQLVHTAGIADGGQPSVLLLHVSSLNRGIACIVWVTIAVLNRLQVSRSRVLIAVRVHDDYLCLTDKSIVLAAVTVQALQSICMRMADIMPLQ